MDAVIQVEATQLRTVVTESVVIVSWGLETNKNVSTWNTVMSDSFLFIRNSIKSNAPNKSYILV